MKMMQVEKKQKMKIRMLRISERIIIHVEKEVEKYGKTQTIAVNLSNFWVIRIFEQYYITPSNAA